MISFFLQCSQPEAEQVLWIQDQELVQSPEIPIGVAWKSKTYNLPLVESLGKISGDIICPYPPGIPMLIPGELLDLRRVEWLLQQQVLWPDQIPAELRVL